MATDVIVSSDLTTSPLRRRSTDEWEILSDIFSEGNRHERKRRSVPGYHISRRYVLLRMRFRTDDQLGLLQDLFNRAVN